MSGKGSDSILRKQSKSFYLYISPWIIGFACFTVIPMLVSLALSFTDANILTLTRKPLDFVGVKNFIKIFTKDDKFTRAILNTFYYTFIKVTLGTFLSLMLALLLNRGIKGKKVFRTLIYAPAVIPVVGSTLLWRLMIFQDRNIISYVMHQLSPGNINFFSPALAMPTIIGITIWGSLGPGMIIFLAALQQVPKEQTEAAVIDGAGPLKRFTGVTLPNISSSVFFVLVTGFIGALQIYAEMKLLTSGGPQNTTFTMAMAVVENAFSTDARGIGYASAQAWVVFAFTSVFTLAFFKISSKHVYYDER